MQSLTTGKAEFVVKTFPITVEDEKLRIEIVPVDGGVNFAINSMIVRGPKQQGTHRVWPQQPPAEIPTLAEIQLRGQPDPAKALKTYCDWLLRSRPKAARSIRTRRSGTARPIPCGRCWPATTSSATSDTWTP